LVSSSSNPYWHNPYLFPRVPSRLSILIFPTISGSLLRIYANTADRD